MIHIVGLGSLRVLVCKDLRMMSRASIDGSLSTMQMVITSYKPGENTL